MAIFTAIAAVVTTVGTFFAAAGAIGTFVLQTAVGVGLNLLAKHIAGQQQAPEATGPGFSVQGKLTSGGDVPRSFIMGWRVTAGSLVYANTWGEEDNGKTPNAYLTQVIAVSDLPVKGLVGIWVNGEWRQISATDQNEKGFVVDGYRKDDRDHLWVRFYDGTQTIADELCVDTVSSPERPYQASRVGTGVAYAVVTCRVNDELFSGFPQFKFEIDGVPLYDPSKDDTIGGDGDQRWDAPSTWGGDGDDLPAVQAYNILRGITFGGEWLYGLQSIAGARLPGQNWIAQIAKCRAVTEGPDGDEPTYRSSAEIYVNNDIASTVEALLTACQGRLSEIGGFYKMHCGAPGSAAFSFTDDDIISTQEQSFTPFFGLSDTVNGITAKYPEPAEGWNTKAAPPIYRTDLEALAGGRRLLSDVSLDLVPYSRQVQQLMQEALQEAQRARRHTFVLPPAYWIVEPGDIGEWTSARNGYETKLFRVDGALDRGDLDVMLDLTEVDPEDYDFDFETDYTAPIISPTIIVRPPAQAIVEFQAFANEITNGVVSRPGILLTWNGEDLDDIIGIAFEVRTADDETVIIRGRTDNPNAGSLQIEGNGLLPATDYEVRARYIPASPRDVEWSGWLAITTTDTRYNFADLDTGPRDYLTNQFRIEVERMKEAIQAIAAIAGAQDAFNFLDKKENRRLMKVGTDRLSASIEEVELVAVTAEQAVASLTTTVNAAISDIGAIETGLAEVTNDFSAFAGPGGTFGTYQTTVAATLNGLNNDITAVEGNVATTALAVANLDQALATLDTELSAAVSDIGAVETGLATANSNFTAFAGPGGTFASYQTTVSASLNGLTGQVSVVADALADIEGNLSVAYGVNLDVNGYATGFKQFNTGTTSGFVVVTDYFQIAKPGVSGGNPKTVFEVGTVGGVPAIVIKGNLISDGTIAAINAQFDTANITNLNATNINSNYAIFNVAFSGGPFLDNIQSEWNGGNSSTGVIFSKTFTTATGNGFVFANILMGAGSDPGFPPAGGLSVNIRFRIRNTATNAILFDRTIFTSTTRPGNLNNQTGTVNAFATLPAATQVTAQFLMDIQVGALGGSSGQENYEWRIREANLLFLEPNGT